MRLTTVILIATLMQVSAATFGQSITINERKASFEQVLKSIRSQSGYDVIMDRNILKKAGQVNMSVKDATIDEAMKSLLSGLPLKYTIDGKIIVIEEKSGSFIDRVIARFQAIDVRGKVVDSLGNGLAGATVSVKNGKGSTSTDAGGNFYLKNVDEGVVLVVNYLGYVTREIPVSKEFMYVQLQQSMSKLDEVQIQAYGVTSRRLSTGNISSVKAEDIAKQPVANPLLALAGRVPGLEISQASGLPGSGISLRIQGQNSLNANANEPFFVIDGVPYPSTLTGTVGSPLFFGNPLNYINPLDIESINVLKDASATAIYGSRAQNGAILITTKKGIASTSKIDLNVQSGIGQVARRVDLLNTNQYRQLRQEAFSNDGVDFVKTFPYGNPDFTNLVAYDLFVYDSDRNTDWQKELIGNTASYSDAQLAFSGGSPNTQYRVSSTYHRETTVFPGDQKDQKGAVQFNLTGLSNNQKFRFALIGSYMLDNNRLSGNDLTNNAMKLAPNAPSLYNSDGSLNWAPVTVPSISFTFNTLNNPLAALTKLYRNRTNNMIGNSELSYQLFPAIIIKSSFGFNRLQQDEVSTNPSTTVGPADVPTFTRSADYGQNITTTWNIEPQITYAKSFGRGKIDVLLGTTIQQNNVNRQVYHGEVYPSDLVLENPSAAQRLSSSQTVLSEYKYNAVFGRINYNQSDKYILELAARRDGSSRFGYENRFNNFASASGAWVFSDEGFIKNNLTFLSFGKLRASYGTTGNDQIGDYNYLSLYYANPSTVLYDGGTGTFPGGLSNPFIQWEETRKLSAGLDLGFIKDNILVNLTYYRNRSGNQLVFYNLPPSVGFTGIFSNFPALIENSGLELSLNTTNLQSKAFKWTSSVNITVPKNKLIDFPNLEGSSYANDLIIGEPITKSGRLYKYAGVDPVTGKYQYRQKDGTLSFIPFLTPGNDYERINIAQQLYGGIQNSLTYRQFSFDFLFQFVKQKGQNYFFGQDGQIAINPENRPVTVLNRWQNPGDNQKIGQISNNGDVTFPAAIIGLSDAVWGDASYIRLRNASLSWQIPENLQHRLKLQNAKIYLQGQNLLTITRYEGLDPETKSSLTLPPLRVITLGVQLTF